ncbi:galanin receptor 2a-like [Littorina saxatilis]|uniref:G-protein coupled receptors family 1 profile domain-containing protein n=1 Tax=Littorina saxatilis TaxID=31220 RepID=A0AAN9G071_9CAEN
MQTVFVPFIFVFGVIGNLLAIGCFLSQSLRSTSCCLYLAAKCSSDTIFLAALFVMWLQRVHVEAVNVQGVCQLTVFFSYVSGFVSVWLVLAITYENYIRICCPVLAKVRCTRRVALTLITAIVVFAVIFYSFALWTTNVLGSGTETPLCMSLIKFKDVLMVMTFIDTLITLVLPCLIIVPLVATSLLAILQALDRKNRLHDSLLGNNKTHLRFLNSLEAKVAKFLLTVSLTFLLLHTPGHLIRLKLLIGQFILHAPLADTDAMLQRLFETLYYFNFCCSVVIFLASGANFRAIFVSMYFRRLGALHSACADSLNLNMQKRSVTSSCENQAFDPESQLTTTESVLTTDTGHQSIDRP